MSRRPRSTIMIVTVAVWAIAVFVLEALRVHTVLSAPQVEEYVTNLEFQLAVSVLTVATWWLPLLGAVLLLELVISWLIAGPRRRARARRPEESEEY